MVMLSRIPSWRKSLLGGVKVNRGRTVGVCQFRFRRRGEVERGGELGVIRASKGARMSDGVVADEGEKSPG